MEPAALNAIVLVESPLVIAGYVDTSFLINKPSSTAALISPNRAIVPLALCTSKTAPGTVLLIPTLPSDLMRSASAKLTLTCKESSELSYLM